VIVERIVVTGLGVVSALGAGREAFWRNLAAGASGLRPLSLFDPKIGRSPLAGEIAEFSPAPFIGTRGIRHFDRTTLLLACAAKLALKDAGVLHGGDAPARGDQIGIAVGSTYGSIGSIAAFDTAALRDGPSYVNPMEFPNTVLNAPASRVSIVLGVTGPNATIATGESSALDALSYAADFLRLGRAGAMLAGGVFGLGEDVYRGFAGTGALSGTRGDDEELCAPFDRRRNGLVLGEGSCLLFLEPLSRARGRGAGIYGEVTGYGNGFRPRGADPVTSGRRVLGAALARAGRSPQDVSCVFGGANSTPTGDRLEAQTLRATFASVPALPPVSAIKSMCGECLDASGALQAAAALLALREQVVPPTINHQVADDECGVDCVPNAARRMEVKEALVTASSSAGHCSAVLLSACPDA
jgi:3-oxoacyl-[acyl-carrier-protein] synthase II